MLMAAADERDGSEKATKSPRTAFPVITPRKWCQRRVAEWLLTKIGKRQYLGDGYDPDLTR